MYIYIYGFILAAMGSCWRVLDKGKIQSDMSNWELTLTSLWDLPYSGINKRDI